MRDLLPALTGLSIAALAAAWGLTQARPPEVVAAGEAGAGFSAERAFEIVERLAANARPIATPEHRNARHSIREFLRDLGLDVEEQTATVSRQRRSGRIEAARIRNVLARRSGDGTPGAVLLLAHYDTRPATPGAADDAAGVAAVLEVVRILSQGPPGARDLIVLISDGEEYGLFGAQAFVEQHAWAADVEFVLNLEARGNRGPSMMFETMPGNLEMVSVFAARAPFPFANSLSYEVYRRMPNDSDFSTFRETAVTGLNFAFIGNLSAYHTQLDSADRLDRRSLQHHGSNLLALTRHLQSLQSLRRSGEDAVYFNLTRRLLVVYPSSVGRILAFALVLLAAAALVRSSRSETWTARGLFRGAVLPIAAVAVAGCLALLFWKALALAAPVLLEAPHGRPFRGLWLGSVVALLTVIAVGSLAGRARQGVTDLAVVAGSLLVWTLLALLTALWLPGASFLFMWPAAGAWIGWWLLARAGAERSSWLSGIVLGLGASPGAAMLAPLVVLFLEALTLSGATAPAAVFALGLTLVSPQLATVVTAPRMRPGLLTLAAAVLLVTAGASGRSVDRPKPNSLLYVESAAGSFWYSLDRTVDHWTSGFLGDEPEQLGAPSELSLGGRTVLRSPAPALGLPVPTVNRAPDADSSDSEVWLEVATGNGGQILYLAIAADEQVEAVKIGDARYPVEGPGDEVRLTLLGPAPPAVPWRLGLTTAVSGTLRIDLLEQRFGLPEAELEMPGRPGDVIPTSSWRTDSTYVHRRSVL